MRDQKNSVERMISLEEVAVILDVKPQTVRRWAKTGRIPPPVRFGRRVLRWHLRKLMSWLAAQADQATNPEPEPQKDPT